MQSAQCEREIQIIKRDDIPGVTSVHHEGREHSVGLLKDWRKHEILKDFIPESVRPSFSWAKLKADQSTEVHVHPTDSLLVIAEGSGEVIGSLQSPFNAGDIILIPSGCTHGFRGRGDNGFWAISVQFEGKGLFEDLSSPRIHYCDLNKNISDLTQLLKENAQLEKDFYDNPLIKLVKSEEIVSPKVKFRLLEALNVWSDWFQKIIFSRASFSTHPELHALAIEHLKDELGHNKLLYELRNNEPVTLWDPLLESLSAWFSEKMMTISDEEKTVLMHFVLEGSASVFHTEALNLFPKAEHFEIHSTLDEDHFQMGVDALSKMTSLDLALLQKTLKQGWTMLNLLCERMAMIALGKQ